MCTRPRSNNTATALKSTISVKSLFSTSDHSIIITKCSHKTPRYSQRSHVKAPLVYTTHPAPCASPNYRRGYHQRNENGLSSLTSNCSNIDTSKWWRYYRLKPGNRPRTAFLQAGVRCASSSAGSIGARWPSMSTARCRAHSRREGVAGGCTAACGRTGCIVDEAEELERPSGVIVDPAGADSGSSCDIC